MVTKWIKIRGVEYSTNFNFFLENQIVIAKSGLNYRFASRIENYNFYTVLVLNELTKEQEKEICHKVFISLKNGNYENN
jgi:hypothetical protein